MAQHLKHLSNLRHIFQCAVESVRPKNLLSDANNYCLKPTLSASNKTTTIQIQGKTLELTDRNCHVVGFGKAVLGMAVQLERALAEHLSSGIISIPAGTLQQFHDVPEMQLSSASKIRVFEGAPNNQPDEVAMQAAQSIKHLAESMQSNDILFVLISGGGSALLPLPRAGITLQEKMELVRTLANKSATINEMNTVRIALSDIKGGRLAVAARNAYAVISFVISDIVGDPVDLIASGPTCAAQTKRMNAKEILEKYELWQSLPEHVQQIIAAPMAVEATKPGTNNAIYVVGDNRVATAMAVKEALNCGYNPFIATTTLQGEVTHLVTMYTQFLQRIYEYRNDTIKEQQLKEAFPFDPRTFQHFLKTMLMCEKSKRPLLLILAGEPTVKVTGRGLGGRNQELALRLSLAFYGNATFADVCMLSAGTDGIDGPTPAAGAIGSSLIVSQYLENHTMEMLETHLVDNDSYNFYRSLADGCYHVITGHTGTNVMDLQLVLVP